MTYPYGQPSDRPLGHLSPDRAQPDHAQPDRTQPDRTQPDRAQPPRRYGLGPLDVPRARRTLTVLAIGHAVVIAGIVLLAVILVTAPPTPALGIPLSRPARDSFSPELFGIGLLAFAVGRVLAIGRLRTSARSLSPGGRSLDQFARHLRYAGWPSVLAIYPALLGMPLIFIAPPPPPRVALLVLLVTAALLLDHTHAAWTYRHLSHLEHHVGHTRSDPDRQPLPPRWGSRVRNSQAFSLVLTAALVAACVPMFDLIRGDGQPTAPLPALVQIAAAIAVIIVSLLHIPVHLLLLSAVLDDTVHLGALDRVAAASSGFAAVGVPAGALVSAALTTAVPTSYFATTGVVLVTCSLMLGVLQMAGLSVLRMGDIRPRRSLFRRSADSHPT